jgi:mRNA-degrading endonuclease HigB of HigAB toxin-antitoxin module
MDLARFFRRHRWEWQVIFVKFVGTHAEYDKVNAETVELA